MERNIPLKEQAIQSIPPHAAQRVHANAFQSHSQFAHQKNLRMSRQKRRKKETITAAVAADDVMRNDCRLCAASTLKNMFAGSFTHVSFLSKIGIENDAKMLDKGQRKIKLPKFVPIILSAAVGWAAVAVVVAVKVYLHAMNSNELEKVIIFNPSSNQAAFWQACG